MGLAAGCNVILTDPELKRSDFYYHEQMVAFLWHNRMGRPGRMDREFQPLLIPLLCNVADEMENEFVQPQNVICLCIVQCS